MQNKIVMGNWKMNGDTASVTSLITGIINNLPKTIDCTCVVLPPAIFIPKVQELTKNSNLSFGAQNIYPQKSGAFTGELSGPMLAEFGCKYILVGHSERRHILKENNSFVAEKFHYVKTYNLTPVLCIGETLEQREQGLTEEILSQQLLAVLENGAPDSFKNSIIAYEPVWAIGTGKTATPQQVQKAHSFIRNFLSEKTTSDARSIPLLYGGSVNEGNAEELFNVPDVDGGLIGGASLDYTKFLKIITAAL